MSEFMRLDAKAPATLGAVVEVSRSGRHARGVRCRRPFHAGFNAAEDP
jgi:hypothetical protein